MHKILIYLHIIHLLKSSTCFEHYPAHLQEVYVVIVCMQPLVSSLSAGDCLVHRLRKTQNSYLFTYNTFIKILYMFRALPCSSSGGLRRNCTYAASGIVTVCRWLSCAPIKKQNSYLFTYNTFIKILYMFRALPCSSSGGLRRNCTYAASGIVTVCRWLSCAPIKK